MAIEWKESYKIGDAEIDVQHEELFRLINRFLEARDKPSMTLCAMQLFKYTREHFAHEEKLMRELDYPEFKAHIAWHDVLIDRLNQLSSHIANDTLQLAELEAFLSDWALHHISREDARLVAYVANSKTTSPHA